MAVSCRHWQDWEHLTLGTDKVVGAKHREGSKRGYSAVQEVCTTLTQIHLPSPGQFQPQRLIPASPEGPRERICCCCCFCTGRFCGAPCRHLLYTLGCKALERKAKMSLQVLPWFRPFETVFHSGTSASRLTWLPTINSCSARSGQMILSRKAQRIITEIGS